MTGDRISIDNINSLVYCIGRTDSLVKIKGVFVDLYDIQKSLSGLTDEYNFIISHNDSFIIFYVETNPSFDVGVFESTIYKLLSSSVLPLVSLKFVYESCFRLNRSGKVDKRYYRDLSLNN